MTCDCARGWIPLALLTAVLLPARPARCLPPPEDPPEEILRTQVITAARSPLDGEPLTPAAYATLTDTLQDPNRVGTVPADLEGLIRLLEVRRVVRPILPFIP